MGLLSTSQRHKADDTRTVLPVHYSIIVGCITPTSQVARLVSFSSPGYLAMPFLDLSEDSQLTFKFRTQRPDGLIFYASSQDHSSFLAVGLRGGRLFLQARPGGEVHTEASYDDGRWHYVTASFYSTRLRLDVDDGLVVRAGAASFLCKCQCPGFSNCCRGA